MRLKVLGIDLGTSNTYLYGLDNLSGVPEPLVLPGISDASGSISTVVLYENGRALLAGNVAESEFFAHGDNGGARRLLSQFKPEIAHRAPWAMEAMTDFLRLVREALPPGAVDGADIFVGMPTLSLQDYALNMGECFTAAGWPRPGFARESDAALISCLAQGLLSMDDIDRKCVILDFGGGTFDYTAVESLNVLSQGGDALYGGRLFDDLFFQIFSRRNPELAASSGDFDYFVRWIQCKAQKEEWSRSISAACAAANSAGKGEGGEPSASLHLYWFDSGGDRHDAFLRLGLAEFVSAAENYQASESLLRLLAGYAGRGGLGAEDTDLLAGRRVALLSWLGRILAGVPARGDVASVILTGGSSRWFFTGREAAAQFPAARVTRSGRDFEDIAYGLALYPGLCRERDQVRRLLDGKAGAFCRRAEDMAGKLLRATAETVIERCAGRIVERDIMPPLMAARERETTFGELEEEIERNVRGDGELYEICREQGGELASELRERMNAEFRAWLRENGVTLAPRLEFPPLKMDFFESFEARILDFDNLALARFILTRVLPLVAGLGAAGVMAHTFEPVSTAIAGSVALGGTWVLARTAPDILRQRRVPKLFLGARARALILRKLGAHVRETLGRSFGELEKQLGEDVRQEVKDALGAMLEKLGIFNQIVIR